MPNLTVRKILGGGVFHWFPFPSGVTDKHLRTNRTKKIMKGRKTSFFFGRVEIPSFFSALSARPPCFKEKSLNGTSEMTPTGTSGI